MKKKVKKQLKEDEFVHTIQRLFDFAKERSRELIIAGVAVCLILVVVVAVKAIQSQSIKKESRILGEILDISGQLDDSPENVAELEQLAGDGKFSRVAYLKLSSYWVDKGDIEKAKSALANITDRRKDLIYYQAQDMLGQIYIENGEFDKAIELYKEIEKEDPEDYALDAVLFREAQAYEQKGELDSALELYKRIKDEFSQTFYGFDANKKVEELEEKK
jgi:tetratricopeptide (TPR) repeat protein